MMLTTYKICSDFVIREVNDELHCNKVVNVVNQDARKILKILLTF